MIDKIEETPRLINRETYMSTHNILNTYNVLIFTDLNKTQIYKVPHRVIPHHEIEIIMSFSYLNMFKPNGHTEYCHFRKPNVENFLFELEHKNYIYVGEKELFFETNGIMVKTVSGTRF